MSFSLVKAIFINRAPFERLELDFKEKGINVLSAINGKGKTTILSHITDAFYELAKKVFHNEFEGRENKYYRVSSSLYNLNQEKPSFVYLRFKCNEKDIIDYVDIRNECTEAQYNSEITIERKIEFDKIYNTLSNFNHIKYWSLNDEKKIKDIFSNSVLTYFPSYRYETPSYLNDPYNIKLDYAIKSKFDGYLINQIEVVSEIEALANWIMDIVIDGLNDRLEHEVKQPTGESIKFDITPERAIFKKLNDIISFILSSKYPDLSLEYFRFGIGKRNDSGQRISIGYDNEAVSFPITHSIFCLSSGELALLSLFGEILRQADNIHSNIQLGNINGIVLIDEVDKHLHIKLQKEILPKLFGLFPNIQFIVSSHSPFLNMGLADTLAERSRIIDLDNNGITCSPTNNDLYREVYDMMINENQRYVDKYNDLVSEIKSDGKPIIITEGKTDYRHIRNAINKLGRTDIDVDFYEVPNDWGESRLWSMLDNLSKIRQRRIVIGIFDRDSKTYLQHLDVEHKKYKIFGDSNVYAFAIPLVNENIYGESISIEHYYQKVDLLKEDINHRRLFLGEEFYKSGNSIDGKYQTKISNVKHKVDINGIIDDKVFLSIDLEQKRNVALTKQSFVDLIETDAEYTKDFDFNKFNQIIDIIQDIIKKPLN
ncbi:MAG: AAA family ATPase [Candidatus Onthomorpha sp.]